MVLARGRSDVEDAAAVREVVVECRLAGVDAVN